MYQASDAEMAQWKKEHGEVYECVVGDKVEKEETNQDGEKVKKLEWAETAKRCYLRKPTRQELGYAMTMTSNPLKSDEILLKNCWLGGDMEIQTDDEYFLGARLYLGNLVNKKEAELKKL